MTEKLKILVLIKPFWMYAKHKPKFEMIQSLEKYADVYYWYQDGHIKDILKRLKIRPHFIFHYDIAWNYGLAPKIDGLADIDCLKGCFVIDLHWKPEERKRYFRQNKIDLIFSATKHPFLKVFPQYKQKLRWLPWAINPAIMKDWKQKKDIDSLLMGLVYINPEKKGPFNLPAKIPPKGRYAFRDAVFNKMKNEPGFVFHPHPGHRVEQSSNLLVNEKYAQELNRAKLFFTCGSRNQAGGVAVMKFFEAPACHTLLLAEPNKDIQSLGFVNEKNYIACSTGNLKEKAKFYLNHDSERKRITKNGYTFIHNHHTNDQRAKYMINAIKANL
ncbi:MAG TPA: glycosyltransferase [Bacillota bacterium]|nr:glycosyltransferase [Bacillota bacterium]